MTATDAPLATGWEQGTPDSDSLLRRFLFHTADFHRAMADAGAGQTLETPDFAASDLRRPAGYWNAATLVRPPDDWEGVIERIERFFATGSGQALLWSAWPTPDLRERGWTLSGHPPLLLRPPAGLVAPPAVDRSRIRRVGTPDALREWERVAIDGYPLRDLSDAAPGTLVRPRVLDDDRLAFWTSDDDAVPVACGAAFSARGISSLAFGATLPSSRQRGHWRALAVERLLSRPDDWFAGVFSDFSRPGAEDLGFVPIQRMTLWILERPASEPA